MDKIIFNSFFIIFGIIIFTLSQFTIKDKVFNIGLSYSLSPRFFPIFTSICLIIFGFLSLIPEVREYMARKNKFSIPSQESTKSSSNQKSFNRVILIIISSIAYIYLFEFLGFILSTSSFLILFMYILGERNWKFMPIMAFIFTLVCYYSFSKGLLIPFP